MRKLVISGKATDTKINEYFNRSDTELWMLGTDDRNGGDLYFELHGIQCKHKNIITKLPASIYDFGLLINNSISAMLVFAWLCRYTDITVINAPMSGNDEYLEQRPSIAYIIGFLKARGVTVNWTDMPKNTNYGK